MNKTERQIQDRELQERVNTATTVAELEVVRAELIEKKKGIEQQLSSRNRTDEFGVRLSEVEYWKWRDKATFAMSQLDKSLSRCKLRLKQLRAEVALRTQIGAELKTATPTDLLVSAYALLKKLHEDVEFTEKETQFLNSLRDYVEGYVPTEQSVPRPDKPL